jgi:N-acetylglutamate synthase-like GNAT family acetyltransferase
MKIENLADHLNCVPIIARWTFEEWSYMLPGEAVADIEKRVAQRANRDEIPMTLVAIADERIVGTVCLKHSDMKTRMDLSPWLGGLYVAADCRHQGIGTQLVRAISEQAQKLSIGKLYLFTPGAEFFYERLGWSVLEQTDYINSTVTMMEMDL